MITKKNFFFLFTILFLVLSRTGFAQDSTQKSLLLKPKIFTPLEVITADTVKKDSTPDSHGKMPGDYSGSYTPEQDSAYARALRLAIPPGSRFVMAMRLHAPGWEAYRQIYEQSPEYAANKALSLPDAVFLPTPQEQALYEYNIQQSMYVPFVSTLPRSGAKIPLSTIGALFGLTEDVSPTMRFAVERPMPVEIVIYSSQAKVVATIFKGMKSPARYEYTWNGRDDNGRPLPPGDYVGEVRLGNERLLRKRIQLGKIR